MTLLDYLLIAAAAIGCAGLGRLFINEGFARYLLVGLIVPACISALLAWFAPLLIAPFFDYVLGLAGLSF